MSAVVWMVVFGAIAAAVSAVEPLGAGSLVFLLPFMMYPVALGISGLVRFEGFISGRSRESGPLAAAILITIACGLFLIRPISNSFPSRNIEVNTPDNELLTADGEVLSATAEQMTVRLGSVTTQSIRLGPDTRFSFLGPGWRTPTTPAGPEWLEPGRRIGLDYVYRHREAWASAVTIWIGLRGCANNEKWAAFAEPSAPASPETHGLTNTRWESRVGLQDMPDVRIETLEFLEGNVLAYHDSNGVRQTNASWRQNGPVVNIEVDDCFSLYEGRLEEDLIRGRFSNYHGADRRWTARQLASRAPAAK